MKFKKTSTALLIGSLFCVPAFAKTHKILLLGCTGDGKTTTLNAIYNSAMRASTPYNNTNNIHFIKAINDNSLGRKRIPESSYDARNLKFTSKTSYGKINVPFSSTSGSSDTSELTGYRFTPNFSGWDSGDDLEIIDTPGINDTHSTAFNNNSTHIQIIQQIEEQLRKNGNDISAVFVVVNNNTTRTGDPGFQLTMQAIREALPPELSEHLFILLNRAEALDEIEDTISETLQKILPLTKSYTRNRSWWGGTSYSTKYDLNYVKINPKYIAQFNMYKDGRRQPSLDQKHRAYTEDNIRETLRDISLFDKPAPIQDYAEYLHYKHQVARHINEVAQKRLEIAKEVKILNAKLQEASTLAKAMGRQHSVGDFLGGGLTGGGVAYTAIEKGAVITDAATNLLTSGKLFIELSTGGFLGAVSLACGLLKLAIGHGGTTNTDTDTEYNALLSEIDIIKANVNGLRTILMSELNSAVENFNEMEQSVYGLSHYFSNHAINTQIQKRIETHFPATYMNQHEKDAINEAIAGAMKDIYNDSRVARSV